jgi:hypothetical protein
MPYRHRPTGGLHRVRRLLAAIARRVLGDRRPRPPENGDRRA